MSGIVLREADPVFQREAEHRELWVTVAEGWEAPYERTLFLGPGVRPGWELIEAGLKMIERWEVAAPLVYAPLAEGLGTAEERERTRQIIRDLRVPTYAPDQLLFARRCEASEQLLEAWQAEGGGGDVRLAFLRALYLVKPLILPLPQSWSQAANAPSPAPAILRDARTVRVQIGPRRFVRCKPEEAEAVRARWAERLRPRRR